jgi:DNA polymerase-3 subunit alpha (Gram-positive type)
MTSLKDVFMQKSEFVGLADKFYALSEIFIHSVKVNPQKRGVKVYITSDRRISKEMMGKIKTHLFSILPKCCNLEVYQKEVFHNTNTRKIVDKSWNDLLKYLYVQIPQSRLWLCGSSFEVEKDVLNIYLENNGIEFFHLKRIIPLIEHYYKNIGTNIKVKFKEKLRDDDKYDINEEDRELVEAILNRNKDDTSKANKKAKPNTINLIGKTIKQNSTPITDANKGEGAVVVEGEVFALSKRQTKNNNTIVTFGLTDYKGSIGVKLFLSEGKKQASVEFNNGMWLKVQGKVGWDKYIDDYELLAEDINHSQRPSRDDNYPEKRIELHLHTRYSAMDAICSPTEVINLAKEWGHKSVAFTDHGVVQCFPEVYEAAKNAKIKPIYGVEAYIFDDEFPVMLNPPYLNIRDAVFVVTDIETTGLSHERDEIIEIGAIKIQDGEIIDQFSALIKPKRPLPASAGMGKRLNRPKLMLITAARYTRLKTLTFAASPTR